MHPGGDSGVREGLSHAFLERATPPRRVCMGTRCLDVVPAAEGYPFFDKPRVAHEELSSAVSSASSNNNSRPSNGHGADAKCRSG